MMILTPGTNGCLSQPVVAGFYWRYRVYHNENGRWYTGRTGWQLAAAGMNYNFGTLKVYVS